RSAARPGSSGPVKGRPIPTPDSGEGSMVLGWLRRPLFGKTAGLSGRGQMLMVRPDPGRSGAGAGPRRSWLDGRALSLAYAVFAVFAGLVALFSGGDDGVWGVWAVGGYAVTAAALWRWPNSITALIPALIGGLAGPLAWLAIHAPVTADVETVT